MVNVVLWIMCVFVCVCVVLYLHNIALCRYSVLQCPLHVSQDTTETLEYLGLWHGRIYTKS